MENNPQSFGWVKTTIPLLILGSLMWAAYVTSVSKPRSALSTNFQTVQHYQVEDCLDDAIKETRTPCCSNANYPAMGGIDVVEMFSLEAGALPKMGDPTIATYLPTSAGFWKFQFISEENKNLFMQDPWHYAPAWGGYCGYGVAFEDKSFDPSFVNKLGPYVDLGTWLIHNDRLFFFGGGGAREKFVADIDNGFKLGDNHWQSYYQGRLEDGHFDTNCFHRETFEDLLTGTQSVDMRAKNN